MSTIPVVDPHRKLRLVVYWLLIVTSSASMLGRLMTVRSKSGKTPMLSANDRSRWCTVRALVDHGTFVIDDVIFSDARQRRGDSDWYTIDMVRHRGHDGREHYYSSKPPLLPTLLAGGYWLIKNGTGKTIESDPMFVIRLMVVVVHVVPLLLYFFIIVSLVERYLSSDLGRIFIVAAATHVTFLSTFAITLNNHLIAAVCVAISVWAVLKIWDDGRRELRYFAVAGFASAFAVANELPALSWFAIVSCGLLWKSVGRTIVGYVPAALVVGIAFFATNYLAHGSWRPPYTHRGDGPVLLEDDASNIQTELDAKRVPPALRRRLKDDAQVDLSRKAVVAYKSTPESLAERSGADDRWVLWDRDGQDRLAVLRFGKRIEVRAWDNWYEYSRSYWNAGRRRGIDQGEPSRGVYALNVLIGHHGIFSLTPIWLLSIVGATWVLGSASPSGLRCIAAATLLLTVVCITFYLMRPLQDRNYGGMTSGFRWMFWLTPLWLLCLAPVADRLHATRTGQVIGVLFLLISGLSAGYNTLNPWRHPWLYDVAVYFEWIPALK